MASLDQQMKERALITQREDPEAELKKLQKENYELRTELSLRTQLLTGRVNTGDMSAIEAVLEKEHQQLMKEREAEIASLKQEIRKLDTKIIELQQNQQQQKWYASLFSCNCGGSDDSQLEQVISTRE